MSVIGKVKKIFKRFTHDSMIWEVTPRCNLKCVQCYNVWKDDVEYGETELSTEDGIKLIREAVKQSGCKNFTFTGGEPSLRDDLEIFIKEAISLGCNTALITNGTLLNDKRIDSLMEAGLELFELPLNSSSKEIHNRMSGGIDSFDKATRAAAHITSNGGDLAFVYVSTTLNTGEFEKTLELGIALGALSFLYNRYNGGGFYHKTPEKLMPSIEQLHTDLKFADFMVKKYGISIGASITMPPCLIERERFPNVGFGFCAAGTKKAYYTLDPVGNVRPCNHTPTIVGNIFKTSLKTMSKSQIMTEFVHARPSICSGCSIVEECLGSCKAAGEVCYGSITSPDPFLKLNENLIKKR
jgi:PqqA peptide cyclase